MGEMLTRAAEPFKYCDGCDGYNCDTEKGCAYPGPVAIQSVAALKEAAEPFARIADLIDAETTGFSEQDELALTYHDYLFDKFTVAQFRALRAALLSTAGGGNG